MHGHLTWQGYLGRRNRVRTDGGIRRNMGCARWIVDLKELFSCYRSADIKIIVLEDREKGYALRGHKKALSSLSFDPQGEFLVWTRALHDRNHSSKLKDRSINTMLTSRCLQVATEQWKCGTSRNVQRCQSILFQSETRCPQSKQSNWTHTASSLSRIFRCVNIFYVYIFIIALKIGSQSYGILQASFLLLAKEKVKQNDLMKALKYPQLHTKRYGWTFL